MINNILQWTGTVSLMTMYVLMNYFTHLHPWNSVAGALGGLCYLIWTIRVNNRPQMLVNAMGILVSIGGIIKAWY